MTRTDTHSPKNLVTEDYEFVGCGDFGTSSEPGHSPMTTGYGRKLIDEGWKFGENESAGQCYHCGARLRYYAVLKHLPTRTLVQVGETCLGNRFDRSSAEFHEMRKNAQLDREAMRIKTRRTVWFAIDQDRQVAYEWAAYMVGQGDYGFQDMRSTFIHQVSRYGDTSAKFVRAIMRDMVRTERREEERAAREAAEAEWKRPVVTGKGVVITGEVVSVKWQENDYGSRQVMTVKDERGFLVWGSVPGGLDAEKGARVTFTANVEAAPAKRTYDYEKQEYVEADRDESFGFFKRPRKAELIEGGE